MNYKEFIQTFVDDVKNSDLLSSASIFLFRKDGILLFHRVQAKQKISAGNITSVGALMSGVWQASQALIGLLPQASLSNQEFRLAFDTSETGFYLLPMKTKALGEVYLGAVYLGELNPALVKSKFRTFAGRLVEALSDDWGTLELEKTQKLQEEDKLLFQNITDKEIDKLFEGARI